ncbi:enoyl-CoA hydratase/isomerase family protein [Mycolicibacterium sp. A43C]
MRDGHTRESDPTVPLLTRHDNSYILDLGCTENRFTPDWLAAVNQSLDRVVTSPAPLVVTATGKFYSNGLDLEWIGKHADQYSSYVTQVHALLARLLTLPVPTAAAINGHAFGAGAMLAIACDWRIMRADRGYFCFPEIDIHIPFTTGMSALIQSKTTPRVAMKAMTTGHRFTGPEALAAGLIDNTAPNDDLIAQAIALIAPLAGKPADTLAAIKTTMFAATVNALTRT